MSKTGKVIHISVLGDSVSTLEGFNPENCKVFYEGKTAEHAQIFSPGDTWWGRLIEAIPGGRLLVNYSWSGSRVTKLPFSPVLYPSACIPPYAIRYSPFRLSVKQPWYLLNSN